MKKNILFLILLVLCTISLILGVITPKKYTDDNKTVQKSSNTDIKKILNAKFNRAAVISIDGVISSEKESNIFADENSSASALKMLRDIEKDDSVKGVLLKINSPGGTVAMSQAVYNEILRVRKKKPVVTLMYDVAASGGYYIACASDRIIAHPGTLTGSIGVIMSSMDIHKLLSEKLSVSPVVIKSGKYKDIGSSTRSMSADERELLQNIVNDSYSQFKEAITNGRINRKDNYEVPKTVLTSELLNNYADGRVFTGRQALKLGFVDVLGDIYTAEDVLKKMIIQNNPGMKDVEFVNYSKNYNFMELFGIPDNSSKSVIRDIVPTSWQYSKKPLYLWE